jgi:pimeloyl-ACP methyl ester carboxylesterase
MDRRGRGESGDAATYELEREFEDVAAVVDAADEPAVLLGHSYGALCALEATLRTDNLRALVLYEPPIPWGIFGPHLSAEEVYAEMEALLADGEDEQALTLFFEEIVRLPPAELEAVRSAPNWPARIAAVDTVLREERAPAEYEFDAARFAEMTTPTLLLSGGDSPQYFKDATSALDDALPNSRIVTIEGQTHVAMNTAPDRFIHEVLAFTCESN